MESKLRLSWPWSRAMNVIHTHDPKRGSSNACSGKFLGKSLGYSTFFLKAICTLFIKIKVALKLTGIWIQKSLQNK